MALEYARLDLLRDIETSTGGRAHQLVVLRPTARDLINVFAESGVTNQLNILAGSSVRAINGSGNDLSLFDVNQLDAADGAEVAAMLSAMNGDADGVPIGDGDGINSPLVYTLQRPLELAPAEADREAIVVKQISFEARRLGELSEYLDARGAGNEYYAFMRSFGTLLGTKLPMSDAIAGALDFLDYLVIRRKIMGKLTASRGRWKRVST
jgi:hypothetical protein